MGDYINIKSDREVALMREAGRIVANTHKRVRDLIKPGITTQYLNDFCEYNILELGGIPSFKGLYGFPSATCMSVNEVCQ